MISGKNISFGFKNKKMTSTILKNVSFEIKKGLITAFIGHSGAGKTSLLKCTANLLPYYAGDISYCGNNLKSLNPVERATAIGYVSQQFHLFPHLTVLQNCTYALVETIHHSKQHAEETAIQMLQMLGLETYSTLYPKQLSGGQQQRVAIARALVLQPQVLLLDEPTSALDPKNRTFLEDILLNLKAKGMTIALSSHDMPFVRNIQNRIYFMEDGQIIEEQGGERFSSGKIRSFLNHN